MATLSKALNQIKQALELIPDIQIAIVYGSFAKGTETPKSDVDIAVAGSKPLTGDEKVHLINRLSAVLNREIDLIDLRVAAGTVLKEALTTGKILLKRDSDLYAQVLTQMIFDEEDFQKRRKLIMTERRKRAFNA